MKTRQLDREIVDWWNLTYPVGADVIFCWSNGHLTDAKTTAPAQMLGGITPVIWVDAAPGPVALCRVMGSQPAVNGN